MPNILITISALGKCCHCVPWRRLVPCLHTATAGSTQPPSSGRLPAGTHDKVDAAAGGAPILEAEGGSCSLGGTRELSSLPASVTSPLQPHLLALGCLVDRAREAKDS